jgi:alpha-glucosidase
MVGWPIIDSKIMSVTSHSKPTAHRGKPAHSTKASWWQTGVIYQIYVRSFKDSDGDGVGDLRGVISKLDYLQELGIDGIWLSPVTVSANADWGYDVVDYYGIDPALGTLADFDELLAAAHAHNIKVITDFVPNHTSVQHPWFQNALTGRDAEYRDYYVWADPKPGNRPPSNWKSAFGGSCWEYHAPTNQYYLHSWYKAQADLNWRNPAVQQEFERVIRFWLDRGVDGLRIDVVNMLVKDAHFRDNPKSTDEDGLEIRVLGQRPTYNHSQPELHGILQRWRQIAGEYPGDRVLLGENTIAYDINQLASLYGAHDELDMAFNLAFIHAPFKAPELRRIVEETDTAIPMPDWPVWNGSNHDQPRFPSRWCNGDERKIRCALMMLLCLRGTPVLYYGDELGMTNTVVSPWRFKDSLGKQWWPVYAGRDRSRTPMPWRHQKGAGFTRQNVRPWLPYGELELRSVEGERRRVDSTLKFTQDLLALRRRSSDLRLGSYKDLEQVPSVWAWLRGEHTTVVINMSDHHHETTELNGVIMLGTNRRREGEKIDGLLHLAPWEGVILQR